MVKVAVFGIIKLYHNMNNFVGLCAYEMDKKMSRGRPVHGHVHGQNIFYCKKLK